MDICVYGASSNAIEQSYIETVEELGREMARRGHGLVYGGGAQGLMGAVARGVHEGGGKIVGVAPNFFDVDGVLFENCTEFIHTETMRQRKQTMEDRADAFIMTPGGFGTFEEFFEILTLKQLKRHKKAIVVLNINGYYNEMTVMIDRAMEQHFVKPACAMLYEFIDNIYAALEYLENYSLPELMISDMRNIEADFTYDAVQKVADTR